MAGQSKIYHQITHDEPTDARLGYQPETSKLAGQVMQGLGAFLAELDAIKEGDRTLLDNSLVMAFSDTGYAKIHAIENIPMFLAGGAAGAHKTGQHVVGKGDSVTRVSLTAMQLVGAPVGEFGSGSMKTSAPLSEVMA
jgi:Asp/Glu/hydantoin racemase